MIVTFLVEISLAAYLVIRYKMTAITRLAVALLFFLAVFQMAEFHLCGHDILTTQIWTRLGYMSITLLPPLSLHLLHVIAKRKANALVVLAYISSVSFALIFGLSSKAFAGQVCGGNYAIFHLISPLGGVYFIYYYFWLIIGITLSLYYSLDAPKRMRTALIMQAFGYLSFIIPTAVVNTVNPSTIDGLPSIMCGFAVIYALILAFGIVPVTHTKKLKK